MQGATHPMEADCAERRAAGQGRQGDAREGVSAFLEKRPAAFANRVSTDLPDVFPEWIEPEFR